jgi:murein DD-endopeptidase MepM/ murein hydrolase activator NlpD
MTQETRLFQKSIFKIIAVAATGCLLLSSCTKQSLRLFKSSSARTQYIHTLETAGIANTKVGVEWLRNADKAIASAPELDVPFSLQGSFKAKTIEAKAWRIQLEQGASVHIHVNWQARDSSNLIVDLLEGPEWKELTSFHANPDSLKFEADRTGQYLLRIQPELLGEGNFQVRIDRTSTYAVFPVQGKNSRSVQSFWGDVRDGGKRSHEGVDIFAPRGTPVLAPVEGVVTAVRDSGLGGKQVWLRDPKRGWRLYFAHLDSQLVNSAQRVSPGDTLGLVGNTGNARHTAPHLHFGVYQFGAINPFPIIEDKFPSTPKLAPKSLESVMKVNSSVNVRQKPSTKSEILVKLDPQTPVFVMAATASWYQVKTLDGLSGFISQGLLVNVDSTPIQKELTYAFTEFNSFVRDSLLVDTGNFVRLGTYEGYQLIRDQQDNLLYLPNP